MGTKAQQKLEALAFWDNHGINATQDAFKVSRATLYRWKQNYEQGGISALHDASRVSRHCRRRNWSPKIIDKIRRLRQANPNVGNEKIYCWIEGWCDKEGLPCPKPRTIARLIADAPDKTMMAAQFYAFAARYFWKAPYEDE